MWLTNNLQVPLTTLQAMPKTIKYGYINSKFGKMLLGLTTITKGAKSCNAICLLYFVQKSDIESLKEVQRRWPNVELVLDAVAIEKCMETLYSDNDAVIDVAVRGTDLQLAVWNELVKLKVGSTITYSELAQLVDRPRAVRAVASAVAKNEVSILIPCHRIVSKSGAVKYGWGAKLKSDLLEYEANT
ncbi:bifunctional transcriptional activator/DNA repair enzyme Ada [Drosophila innubila]|uniref:bifunctional transcriptional activator/DNA repair enzyme Ada n=1 Tax=Drosophila innubila TaxID=198719 RepID=UPI00148BCA48|nr:bifunctional transcriptional activator/DNA repair enzyme Ada [Drosophila innubila]